MGMRIHTLDLPDYEKECRSCEYRCVIQLPKIHQSLEVCRCECGRCVANGGHPLAPCRDCEEEYYDDGTRADPPQGGDYRFCEVDEDCIENGGRCFLYGAWLHQMVLHSMRPAVGEEIRCRCCQYLGLQGGHPHCHSNGCKTRLDFTCCAARRLKGAE